MKIDSKNKKFIVFDREINLPQSRILRILIGTLLILSGLLGFLPVLGFWMVPIGVIVLSLDIALFRRLRRKTVTFFNKRGKKRERRKG